MNEQRQAVSFIQDLVNYINSSEFTEEDLRLIVATPVIDKYINKQIEDFTVKLFKNLLPGEDEEEQEDE
jgi:hypothetical protein